jgi:hypothetical protein
VSQTRSGPGTNQVGEGLKISLANAEDKLAQIDRRTHPAATDLGMLATIPKP